MALRTADYDKDHKGFEERGYDISIPLVIFIVIPLLSKTPTPSSNPEP